MKKIISIEILIIIFLVTLSSLIIPAAAMARSDLDFIPADELNYTTVVGLGTHDLETQIFLIINIICGFILLAGLLITIIGDIRFMALWAKKNYDKNLLATKGKMVFWGWLIFVVILLIYAIASFRVEMLISATSGPRKQDYTSLIVLFFTLITPLLGNIYYLIAWLKKNIKHMILGGKIIVITSMIVPILLIILIFF